MTIFLKPCFSTSLRIGVKFKLWKEGLKNNVDFAFIYNPYFVALGDVIKGLENPDMVLIGCENSYAKKS